MRENQSIKNISNNKDIYIGNYHPFPKEAPFEWRMARMKSLRIKAKKRLAYRKTINYKIKKFLN